MVRNRIIPWITLMTFASLIGGAMVPVRAADAVIQAEPGLSYPIAIYMAKVQEGHRAYRARNFDQAFERYQESARWGEKDCQYRLGLMYVSGEGTATDAVEGYAWIKVAAESKSRDMIKMLKRLREAMTPEDLAAADGLGDQYIDEYGIRARDIRCVKTEFTGSKRMFLDCRKRYKY